MPEKCRKCGSDSLEIMFERADTYFWHGPETDFLMEALEPKRLKAQIAICQLCGFMGIPLNNTLHNLLQTYYTSPHSMPGTTHGTNNVFAATRTNDFFDVLEQIGISVLPRRVLEVGCQQGFLLSDFLKRGTERVVGIEPGDIPPWENEDGSLIDVRRGFLSRELLSGEEFDFAYSLQVFEHVEDQNNFLSVLHDVLCPGGQLLLAVPNEMFALQAGNPGTFVFQHINLFTPETLSAILQSNGFKIRRIISDPRRPLFILGEKDNHKSKINGGRLVPINQKLLADYNIKVEKILDRIEKLTSGITDEKIGLWGANAAMANIFSWRKIFRERKWMIFDSDPQKIEKIFGGIPTKIFPPSESSRVDHIIVIPFMAQEMIIKFLKSVPKIAARVHSLYPF